MKLSQMFPSKYLSAEDLGSAGFVLVTIRAVDWIDVSMHKDKPDDPDAAYIVQFEEFKKPMKLNRTNANMVAEVLKTDETDEWIGRRVRIFPTRVTFGGQTFPVIRVDFNPVHGIGLPPKAAAQPGYPVGRPAAAPFDVKPVGEKNAAAFCSALAEQGKKPDDFLRWAKLNERDVHDRCFGNEMADWPRGAAPLMQRYLRKVPRADDHAQPEPEPQDDVEIPF